MTNITASALFAGCEEGLLSSVCATQTVLDTEKEIENRKAKVKAILLIAVKQYQKHGSLHTLCNRLEIFSKSVAFHGFFVLFIFIKCFAALSPYN